MSSNGLSTHFKPAIKYIENHWKDLERYNPHDQDTLIGLPHPYIVPSNSNGGHFAFSEMYYWDSYFIGMSLLGTNREQFAFYMAENLHYLIKRFGMVPNASRFYFASRSQPPLFTSLILDIYEKGNFKSPKIQEIMKKYKSKKDWLVQKMAAAKREYNNVWMGTKQPHWRQVFKGLSRYYDINVLHGLAETESGWDMTPRFRRRSLDFIPIDLNSLLYKYEADFQQVAEIMGDKAEAKQWRALKEKRRKTINKYLWSGKDGFFFDYDYVYKKFTDAWSLAGFYPMWAGMLTEAQAKALVDKLPKFEFEGGLVSCLKAKHIGSKFGIAPPMQWDYPNGWAPLHWFVIKGLENYGYFEDARRIAQKWIKNNLIAFEKDGIFWEKYNAVDPTKRPKDGVYPQQKGFGWTNAIFVALSQRYPLEH